MRANRVRRVASGLMAVILAAGLLPVCPWASAKEHTSETVLTAEELPAYIAWREAEPNREMGSETVVLTAETASGKKETVEGRDAVFSPADGAVDWTFSLPRAGLYTLTVTYAAVPSASGFTGSAERSLLVNGALPYKEAQYVSFSRRYADEGGFKRDAAGNDLRPAQRELTEFSSYTLRDASGYQTQPLLFWFKAGENRLTL